MSAPIEGYPCSDCPSPTSCATPPLAHCFRHELPFHIFTVRENRARPPVPITYRLILARDGAIGSFCYAHGKVTPATKWSLLYIDDIDVYRIVVEMLAKAFVAAKIVDASPQTAEDGTRFLSVTV